MRVAKLRHEAARTIAVRIVLLRYLNSFTLMPASQFFSMLSSRDSLLQLMAGTRFINPGAMKGCFDPCAACKVNAAYAKTATQLPRVAVEGRDG